MSVPPLLQHFVNDELNRSADLISKTCTATLEQLRQPRDHLLTSSERQHYFELVQVLQQQQGVYQKTFVEALRRLVLADMAPATPAEAAANFRTSGLQLMDETRVESDIEISRAIQQIDNAAEWELRELQTFTSTLRGQAHVTAESNPLRPQSYARALSEAAAALPITTVQQSILLRVSATVIGSLLRTAFAAASTRLETQGVEPGIYRTVVIAPGAGRDAPPEMDVTRPGALDGLMRSMPGGVDTGGPTTAGSGGEPKRRALPTTTPALEQALLRVEELLRRMPTGDAAAAVAAPAPLRLAHHRAALMATAGETVDRQIIELLSRLFETILSDRALPSALQGVIARLQVSALRIALLDPSMLDAYDHPVWQLLDRIVATATAYPHPYDTRLIALQEFCDKLVQQMAAAPQQDSALYRHSLGRLDAFLADQLRRQQREAEPSVETLVRAEQAEALQRTLAGRLVEQMAHVPASPTLRRFITGTWSHVLTQSVQQHGDQSAQTSGYLKTVDELLWSLRLPDHPKSRQRLLELLPGLLQRLRDGMALVHLPPAEQQAVFDELMKVHSDALRPGARAAQAGKPDDQLTPEEIVQRMREEPQPELPESDPLEGPAFSDSLIDLASLETVPAALMDSAEPGSSADETKQWVQRMALGERYRLFLHGAWAHVQLLWRSDQGHFYLFAGELPQQTHSVSLRALERLRAEKLVRPLHDQPLIQRAVDGLLLNLARPI